MYSFLIKWSYHYIKKSEIHRQIMEPSLEILKAWNDDLVSYEFEDAFKLYVRYRVEG